MTTSHILHVTRDAETEYGPEADIECPGVTESCAEWNECQRTFCSARAVDDGSTDVRAHDEEHRYFDEGRASFWGVRSGSCYAMNQGDAAAAEFAEEKELGAGRYPVTVELDESTIILTLVAEVND